MYNFQSAVDNFGKLSDSSQGAGSTGGIPFAQINIKPQSRQKTLKLNPPALPLGSSFSTLKTFSPPSTPSIISEPLLVREVFE